MNCPKCRGEEMRPEQHGGVALERCPVCKGIFLEAAALEQLLRRAVGGIDTFAFSATSDAMDAVAAHCHRCDKPMTAGTGPAELRIDRCEECGGIFLDQGELATLQLHGS